MFIDTILKVAAGCLAGAAFTGCIIVMFVAVFQHYMNRMYQERLSECDEPNVAVTEESGDVEGAYTFMQDSVVGTDEAEDDDYFDRSMHGLRETVI